MTQNQTEPLDTPEPDYPTGTAIVTVPVSEKYSLTRGTKIFLGTVAAAVGIAIAVIITFLAVGLSDANSTIYDQKTQLDTVKGSYNKLYNEYLEQNNGKPSAPTPSQIDDVTGPQGLQGVPGVSGARGISGAPGSNGARGSAGPDGTPGARGDDGRDGAAGEPGKNGVDGIAGAPGLNGTPGEPGVQGAQGLTGERGATGEKGETGPAGPAGLPGEQGVPGEAGPAGPAGPQGEPGPTCPGGAAPTPITVVTGPLTSQDILACLAG